MSSQWYQLRLSANGITGPTGPSGSDGGGAFYLTNPDPNDNSLTFNPSTNSYSKTSGCSGISQAVSTESYLISTIRFMAILTVPPRHVVMYTGIGIYLFLFHYDGNVYASINGVTGDAIATSFDPSL